MKTILFKENTRGHADHGWLDTRHTFSFAGYYDPERIRFGLLRVVNDDIVAGGEGFGTHPHDNMEIVTIPLSGMLVHRDSMGNTHTIREGEIQVMSVGTGITHSEYNGNRDIPVAFLQIWVFPREKGVKPRYDQKKFDFAARRGGLTLIVSPDGAEQSAWVHQDVWFSIGDFNDGDQITYAVRRKGNGIFAMVIEGRFEVDGTVLDRRDAIGISETDHIAIKSLADDSRLLLIDVPMN